MLNREHTSWHWEIVGKHLKPGPTNHKVFDLNDSPKFTAPQFNDTDFRRLLSQFAFAHEKMILGSDVKVLMSVA